MGPIAILTINNILCVQNSSQIPQQSGRLSSQQQISSSSIETQSHVQHYPATDKQSKFGKL